MTDFNIEVEWQEAAEGIRGPELRATWARLAMDTDGKPITKVLGPSDTYRESVIVPLYPLVEWIVLHWWQLFYEVPSPTRESVVDYESRHSLREAREGYAYPPLTITPSGSLTELSWSPEELPHAGVEFIGSGTVEVELSAAQGAFEWLTNLVVKRLYEQEIEGTLLQREWEYLRGLEDPERQFCKAVGSLGLDPLALERDAGESIEKIAGDLPQAVVDEFFDAVDISRLNEEAEAVQGFLARISETDYSVEGLEDLHGCLADQQNGQRPWKEGYRLAGLLRDRAQLDGQPLPTLPDVAEAVGFGPDDLNAVMTELSSSVSDFDAILGYNQSDNPGIAMRGGAPESVRFGFCRSLCEITLDRTLSPALVTKARTERQKRNRAFAAEFLLPSDELRARFQSGIATGEQVEDIADEFGVSILTVQHQLENHRIARIV